MAKDEFYLQSISQMMLDQSSHLAENKRPWGDRGAEIGSFTPRKPPVNRQPIMRPVMEKLNAVYMPLGSGGRRDNETFQRFFSALVLPLEDNED
ncbi:hypothetical protein NPIL_540931 [Nephila pilipes]|uniref:Uncharacterized protein n=1 Tax=Nephila pilipes TaxID=299642 RepID=A0A8X6PGV6_NEPPI|nr:hypothetical protein NPIL_540931 [Nephila pilipes]